MGFLKFLKKKPKGESKSPQPPTSAPLSEDGTLPGFPEETTLDELKLPDIAELEKPAKTPAQEAPKMQESQIPKIQPPPKIEMPKLNLQKPKTKIPQIPKIQPPPKIEMPKLNLQKPKTKTPQTQKKRPGVQMPKPPHAYKPMPKETGMMAPQQTPTRPKPEMPTGETIFIKGEDYRIMLELIDSIISRQKETQESPQKESAKERADEKVHRQFENIMEKVQQKLIEAEKTLFE